MTEREQEQVKEALKRAYSYVASFRESTPWSREAMEDLRLVEAALALLGSNEEEER